MSKIDIPVMNEVDVLILGASSGAIEAAIALRENGYSVFMTSEHSFPGGNICSNMNYWPLQEFIGVTPLTKKIWHTYIQNGETPTPTHVKRTLESALIEHDIDFLYNSYPAFLLRDSSDNCAGAVICNRSGFQAVKAKIIIDATDRAVFGRLSKASFSEFIPGEHEFRFTTACSSSLESKHPFSIKHENIKVEEQTYTAYEYKLRIKMSDASPNSFSLADATIKNMTWSENMVFSSHRALHIPTDRLMSDHQMKSIEEELDDELVPFRCGEDSIYILGANANISEELAELLCVDPCANSLLGMRIGEKISRAIKNVSVDDRIVVDYTEKTIDEVDVCREDHYFRLSEEKVIELDLNRTKILDEVDVSVLGGGTAGASAGIASSRYGAKTSVFEALPNLGGVGTEGRICSYYYGNRCGFSVEMDEGVNSMGANPRFSLNDGNWDPAWKRGWLLRQLLEKEAKVWFGSIAVGAVVQGKNILSGIMVATPYGCGVIRAKKVIDATGNADVAAAAGAQVRNIEDEHVAVQGTGVSPVAPAQYGSNSDHTFVDDTDIIDVTRAFVVSRHKFKESHDISRMINSRERQQIVGDLFLSPVDFLAERTYPDTIVTAKSNFDSHGFTIHPLFMAKAPDRTALVAHVPLRCLLPQGFDNIIVTGLGLSCHRDSSPVIRMQADVQNQGYAVGRIAAETALNNLNIREMDIREIQRHLVDIGNIEPDVLDHQDSFPLSDETIIDAVRNEIKTYRGLAVAFAYPEKSLPIIEKSYDQEKDTDNGLFLARLMALLGGDKGAERLVDYVANNDWDEGWNFTGMGQYGLSLSELDTAIVAMAKTGKPQVAKVLHEKLDTVGFDNYFSHYRALSIAYQLMPSSDAIPAFVRLLSGASPLYGHSNHDLRIALRKVPKDKIDTTERNRELTELVLARALYACGDHQNIAYQILFDYSLDFHGHYSRHAKAILDKPKNIVPR